VTTSTEGISTSVETTTHKELISAATKTGDRRYVVMLFYVLLTGVSGISVVYYNRKK
jgi:hypothetical protein